MDHQDMSSTARGPDDGESVVKEKARQAGSATKDGAQEVAGTVKEQGREVTREARNQVRSVAADLRGSVSGQARTQNQRVADGLRQMSDQFGEMGPGDGSPAGQIVRRLGDGGRRAADYLEDRGPEGLLDDVQEYARRKPGTFLLIAAAAGFAIGRLGRARSRARRMTRRAARRTRTGRVTGSTAPARHRDLPDRDCATGRRRRARPGPAAAGTGYPPAAAPAVYPPDEQR